MAIANTMTPADALKQVPEGLAQLDVDRLATLQFAQQLLGAKARTARSDKDIAAAAVTQKDRTVYFQGLSAAFAAMAVREQHFPVASANTFVVFGHVEDSQGKPLADYELSLENSAKGARSSLISARSDAQGYFTLTLRTTEFAEFVKNETPLFLTVADPKGREVFAPTAPLQIQAGNIAVFAVVDSQAGQAG